MREISNASLIVREVSFCLRVSARLAESKGHEYRRKVIAWTRVITQVPVTQDGSTRVATGLDSKHGRTRARAIALIAFPALAPVPLRIFSNLFQQSVATSEPQAEVAFFLR